MKEKKLERCEETKKINDYCSFTGLTVPRSTGQRQSSQLVTDKIS